MKIKEVEAITGITKQNIRYYEKQGLLKPARIRENDYREYSEEDVRTVKIIKLFRKLDMPIEEIKKLLHNDIALQEAMRLQRERLEKERDRLTDALHFCEKINDTELVAMDADKYLAEISSEERNGAVFKDFLNDFKRFAKAEEMREFSFMPDTMCLNRAEFTEALCRYGTEHNLNLVITKEGMYPEFMIDGVEYEAYRINSRHGAVVRCQMKHMEEIIPEGMTKKRYKFFRRLSAVMLPAVIFLYFVVTNIRSPKELLYLIPAGIILSAACTGIYGYFYNLKD